MSCEYLCEFSKQSETTLVGYSETLAKLIDEKNLKPKISWHFVPLRQLFYNLDGFGQLIIGSWLSSWIRHPMDHVFIRSGSYSQVSCIKQFSGQDNHGQCVR
jgi:hypothetical protein